MADRRVMTDGLVFVVLVALAAGSRLMEFAPNFAAVAAAALFAGVYFRNRWVAMSVPLIAMVLSDAVVGFYGDVIVLVGVYGAMAAPALFGGMLRRYPGWLSTFGGAVAASVLFFVVSNAAVWMAGWYGYSAAGLAKCFVAAIPFFKYTLAGDLICTGLIFGAAKLLALWLGTGEGKAELIPVTV